MNPITSFFLPLLLLIITISVCSSARPDSTGPFSVELKHSTKDKPNNQNNKGAENEGGPGDFFGPGGGFGIPDFGGGNGITGGGYGYGSGYGGPNGGYSKGGIIRPTVVCKEKGPCYKKKLTCPANCFNSYSRSGKGYGGGGGGGGCTMDCKKKCTAYC